MHSSKTRSALIPVGFLLTTLWVSLAASKILAQDRPAIPSGQPPTIAEASDYKSTSTSAEVETFIDACLKEAKHCKKFVFGKSVEGRDLIGVVIAGDYYELGDQDERNVILVLANIHPGECSGKEAVLMLLREFSFQPNETWLDENVIVLVPNYNPDGNDRMGPLNRPGQLGPDNGMGRRENAQELDLNRDFGKLEAPESRALVKLFDQIKPSIFVDCHTTNGSRHQYCLTYDIPHNPATAAPIREYMRRSMMPALTKAMSQKGKQTFYYGNFNRDQTQWYSFGHEPRYSTEYAGLRGALAILVEDYSYISYKERVDASREFVASIFDYASQQRAEIRKLLREVDDDWKLNVSVQPHRVKFSLSAKPTPFPEKVIVKGFKNDQPHDFECEYIGNYVSNHATPLPYAYVLPKEYSRVFDRLKMHGIEVEMLNNPPATEIEVDTIVAIKELPFVFQKHRNRTVEATRKTIQRNLTYGDYLILVDQPLGRLAAYLLESQSDDGFVYWNFFDEELAVDQEYPVIRIPDPLTLQTEEALDPVVKKRLDLDSIDGPHSLLSPPAAEMKWLGDTNLVATNFGLRPVVLDARTASYAPRPALPYQVDKVQAALLEKGISQSQAVLMSSTPVLSSTDGKAFVLEGEGRTFVYLNEPAPNDTLLIEFGVPLDEGNEIHRLTNQIFSSPGELFDFNRDESKLAYVTAKGLHFLDLTTRQTNLVPAPTDKHLIGKLDWVYQEELYGRGNFKGFWWNPCGDEVAFLSLDEAPVPAFTVMDHLPIRGNAEVTNYPKAGEPLPIVKLGVVHVGQTEKVTWIDLTNYGTTELLISQVTWSQNGEILLIQVQNREQTWLDLIAANRQGESAQILFRDKTPAWIESPGHPLFVTEDEFLWISPRDGFRRIYRYNLKGDLLDTLSQEKWEVRSLLGMDQQGKFVFLTGADKPIETHCYRIELATKEMKKLTQGPGTHQVQFSHDFSLFLDRFSNVQRPIETRVCQADGKVLRHLNARSDDRLDYVNITPPEFTTIVTPDDVKLDAMLIKPANFSPYQKYPVLIHIYAGPQTPRVRNRFDGAFYLWHQMLAQQGYVVCLIDNRSASLRNTKSAWPIHLQMAKHEMVDIQAAVDWLKLQTWASEQRIGIWGWSYGGYMTLYALTHSQDFRIGIAGAPVTDWKNYDAIYTERYMGLPEDNPSGYEKSSVLGKADRLHGRLLLIHGTIDDNVHLNNSLQFAKELQDAGILFDMMLYPGNRHAISQPKQAAHLRKLMTDFILKNL